MKKIFAKIKGKLPNKRRLIQLYSALLFNANLKGFANGKIYKGPLKNLCTPGLNCYSCPGASGSCPLGALQNALSESGKSVPYYVVGILFLYGILFGRLICGFLCPFGFIQDLLYKIKTPKLKKNKITRVLSYFKYVIFVFLVIIVPVMYAFRNFPLPAFCKYICPAGTLEGAMGLLSNKVNESQLARLGPLFTWKFALMVSIIVGAIFIYRIFCRFLCPLGAIYGLFNKFSVLGIKLDRPKCIDCGLCISKCKMDISHVADHECISCGECIDVCPTNAIYFKGGKFLLRENDITPCSKQSGEENIESESKAELKSKSNSKKTKIIRIVIGSLMTLLLVGALVYYNFIDKETVAPPENSAEFGTSVGDLCYGVDIPLFDENGELGVSFNPAQNHGKITVINFWGTWCGPCLAELPDFNRIASEYTNEVTVIAIHTSYKYSTAADYIREVYAESNMLFGKDTASGGADYYYSLLDGFGDYPMTLVLDESGVIVEYITDVVHYDRLKSIIENELNN